MTRYAEYFNTVDYLDYLKAHQSTQNTEANGRVAGSDLAVKILKLLSLKPGSFTVEVGCGIGRILHLLHSIFQADVYGCDISLPAIAHIQQTDPMFSARVHHCSSDRLDFLAPSSVDCIVTWGVFELTDQRRTLLEISRVLKLGGVALLSSVKNRLYLPNDKDSLMAHQAYIAKSIPIAYTDVPSLEHLIEFLGMTIKHRLIFQYKQHLPLGRYTLDRKAQAFSEAMYVIEKKDHTPLDASITMAPANAPVKK